MHLLADLSLNALRDLWRPNTAPITLLALGGVGLYVAARAGTGALLGPRGAGGASAGMVAVGHWVPGAAVALAAVIAGRADVAVGVVFAASVAAVSMAVGMTVFLVPAGPLPATRRAWPFLLPAALLVLVAGFGGALNLIHALMLGGLGLAVGGVWRHVRRHAAGDRVGREGSPDPAAHLLADTAAGRHAGSPLPAAAGVGGEPSDAGGGLPAGAAADGDLAAADAARRTALRWRAVVWTLSTGLAVVAARAVVVGTIGADATNPMLRAGIVAAGVIGPLLALPLLAVGSDLAQRGRSGEACSACVGVALLNVFALLPLVIGGWILRTAVAGDGWPRAARVALGGATLAGGPAAAAGVADPPAAARVAAAVRSLSDAYMAVPSLPLPLSVWRIDAVVLAVLALALLPAAVGKWRLGRLEGVALIALYAAYLAASALLVVRSR